MQVVVTGSSGPIGNALCSHLASSGHHVVRVVRRRVRPGEIALAWDPEAGTIDAGASKALTRWSTLPAQVSATADGPVPKACSRREPYPLHRAARGALAGLDHRPRVLVSASAIGFYGDRGDEILIEQSPPGDDFLRRFASAGRPKLPQRHRLASGWPALAQALS